MSRRYVLVNKDRAKAFVRLLDNLDVKEQIGSGEYIELGELNVNEIRYYNQFRMIGFHLVEESKYFEEEGIESPGDSDEQVDASQDGENQEEQQGSDEYFDNYKGDLDEMDFYEGDREEDDNLEEDDNSIELTLEELDREGLKERAKELGVDYYWSKSADTLREDIKKKLDEEK